MAGMSPGGPAMSLGPRPDGKSRAGSSATSSRAAAAPQPRAPPTPMDFASNPWLSRAGIHDLGRQLDPGRLASAQPSAAGAAEERFLLGSLEDDLEDEVQVLSPGGLDMESYAFEDFDLLYRFDSKRGASAPSLPGPYLPSNFGPGLVGQPWPASSGAQFPSQAVPPLNLGSMGQGNVPNKEQQRRPAPAPAALESDSEERDSNSEDEVEEDDEEDGEENEPFWRPPSSLLKRTYEEEEEEEEEEELCGYIRNDLSQDDVKMPTVALHELVFPTQAFMSGDVNKEPRGACRKCRRCERWACAAPSRQYLRWWPRGEEEEEEAELDGGEQPGRPARCQACGCPEAEHAGLGAWMEEVSQRVETLRAPPRHRGPKSISGSMLMARQLRAMGPPVRKLMRLPSVVSHWDVTDAAFFLITDGAYDPRLDGRGQSRASTASPEAAIADPSSVFVSVICPTTESRHAFHPLLYANFARQTHERRELVIVDTGKKPSPFFTEAVVSQDPRIFYRFFPCYEASEEEEVFSPAPGPGRRKKPGPSRTRRLSYEERFRRETARSPRKSQTSPWSLGFKRNLACHLARGAVIAHFDDDDLYSPVYLSCMLKNLLISGCKPGSQEASKRERRASHEASSEAGCGGSSGSSATLGPAIATLSEWHLLDLADQSFGFLSPLLDPLIPEGARESMVLGYGFSYIYTRAAWETCHFPDVDWCEDGDFIAELRRRGAPVVLVRSGPKTCAHGGGLAVHTYHRFTTSGGEFAGFMRLGSPVPAPEDFKEYVPLLRQLASVVGSRTSECHWLRREFQDQAAIRTPHAELGRVRKGGVEVGLTAKDKLIRQGLLIARTSPENPRIPHPSGQQPLADYPQGGLHLRTAPSNRALRNAPGRPDEPSAILASAKGSGQAPLMQFVSFRNMMGNQQQLYTQDVD